MGHHEFGVSHQEIEPSSDRSFGFIMGGTLALMAGFWAWRGNGWWPVPLMICAPFLFLGFARPALLAPLNKGWTRLGLLLGAVVGPIVLAVVFFGIITPLAIIARLSGKDFLRLRHDRAAASYWLPREHQELTHESLHDLF
jgi:hypothetical protein